MSTRAQAVLAVGLVCGWLLAGFAVHGAAWWVGIPILVYLGAVLWGGAHD